MELNEIIIEAYPELVKTGLLDAGINLQNDSDGIDAYIREWNYSKPIPKGLKLGKPSA